MAKNVNRVMMFVIWIAVFIFALTLAENAIQMIALIGILVVVLGTVVGLNLTRGPGEAESDPAAALADRMDDYAEHDDEIYELEESEV